MQHVPGVGPTEELNLRVSVGVLVSVLFKNPVNGKTMLALERTATLKKDDSKSLVVVKAKPLGGGVRLLKPQSLKKLIGEFNYDSERSREEGDFRIQINSEHWEKVKEVCKDHLREKEKGILDYSPVRELTEEFEDSLNISITPENYYLQPRGMMIEDISSNTNNVNATGRPTVRIYYRFNAIIKNPEIIKLMIDNSDRYSDIDLQKKAHEDARKGGKGRANAVQIVFLEELKDFYRSISMVNRSDTIQFKGHKLDGNVPAILDDINFAKYQRYD